MKSPSLDFFESAVAYLIKNEIGADRKQNGGYTCDPIDRGGATKWGCTLATLTLYRAQACTAADVEALTRAEAEALYRAIFWEPLSCHRLVKPQIATAMLDLGALFGVSKAAVFAQLAAQSTGCTTLRCDGIIGTQTIAALNAVDPAAWMRAYQVLFKVRALDIVKRLPDQAKFIDGWNARIDRLKTLL